MRYQSLSASTGGEAVSVGERRWYRHFCCCFGDCDKNGWVSCCTAHYVPCLAVGRNRQKVFGKGGWLWGSAFLVCLLTYRIALHFATEERNCEENYDYYSGDYQEVNCDIVISPLGMALTILGFVAFIALGVVNRIQNRGRLGIKGDGGEIGDWLLWCFCPTCALAQETRTLMHNNVEEGVWQGPDLMVTIPDGTQLTYVQGRTLVVPIQQVHDPHPGDEKV